MILQKVVKKILEEDIRNQLKKDQLAEQLEFEDPFTGERK